ncbi:hypothetical protein INR49_002455 [Caranx melampygus]|nr:hypothetical protein INR49_002455 [Caranx melampygus]
MVTKTKAMQLMEWCKPVTSEKRNWNNIQVVLRRPQVENPDEVRTHKEKCVRHQLRRDVRGERSGVSGLVTGT